jgi:hypothetical protein
MKLVSFKKQHRPYAKTHAPTHLLTHADHRLYLLPNHKTRLLLQEAKENVWHDELHKRNDNTVK